MSVARIDHSPGPQALVYDSELDEQRERRVEDRFFRSNIERYQQAIDPIFRAMKEVRQGKEKKSLPVPPCCPSRLVVISEARANEECFLGITPNMYGYYNANSPYHRDHNSSKPEDKYPHWLAPEEKVVIASREQDKEHEVSYRQETHPHVNHKGNFFMNKIGDYKGIQQSLSALTNNDVEIEKKLAGLLLQFPKQIYKITASDLSPIISRKIGDADVEFINNLCYLLFVKEVSRRKAPRDVKEHGYPWAIMIVKALKLVEIGAIRLSEVVGPDAPYGIFTGSSIGKKPESVKEKMKRINRKYLDTFSEAPMTAQRKNPSKTALARDFYRQMLQDTYGAGFDSDAAAYESSLGEE